MIPVRVQLSTIASVNSTSLVIFLLQYTLSELQVQNRDQVWVETDVLWGDFNFYVQTQEGPILGKVLCLLCDSRVCRGFCVDQGAEPSARLEVDWQTFSFLGKLRGVYSPVA